jgi:hypothetical protein
MSALCANVWLPSMTLWPCITLDVCNDETKYSNGQIKDQLIELSENTAAIDAHGSCAHGRRWGDRGSALGGRSSTLHGFPKRHTHHRTHDEIQARKNDVAFLS